MIYSDVLTICTDASGRCLGASLTSSGLVALRVLFMMPGGAEHRSGALLLL